MSARVTVLAPLALVALLAACGTERDASAAATTSRAAVTGTTAAARDSTETIAWPGFALEVPRGTRRKVSEECPGGRLVGPAVADASGVPRPTFDLCVETHPRRAGQPLVAWVDSVRADRNRMLADDAAPLAPPDSQRIGVRTMLRLQPSCGGCEAFEYYDASGESVAGFSFALGQHLAGDRAAQEAAHLAILQSLRWSR